MEELRGMFWTNVDEMIADIEESTNYDVLSVDDDSIDVIDRTGWDDKVETFKLVRAGKTIAIRI